MTWSWRCAWAGCCVYSNKHPGGCDLHGRLDEARSIVQILSSASLRATWDFLRSALFLWMVPRAAVLSMVEVSLVAVACAASESPASTWLPRRRKRVLIAEVYRRFSSCWRSVMRIRLRCCLLLAIVHLLGCCAFPSLMGRWSLA